MQLRLGLALLEGRSEKRASGQDPCRAHTSPLRDTSRLATLPTCRAAVLLTLLPAWAVASITLDHWGSRAGSTPRYRPLARQTGWVATGHLGDCPPGQQVRCAVAQRCTDLRGLFSWGWLFSGQWPCGIHPGGLVMW